MNKWIITGKLKVNRFAFSGYDGSFALVLFEGDMVRGAYAWDTKEDAEVYLEKQLEAAPDLKKLGPFSIERMNLPQ